MRFIWRAKQFRVTGAGGGGKVDDKQMLIWRDGKGIKDVLKP